MASLAALVCAWGLTATARAVPAICTVVGDSTPMLVCEPQPCEDPAACGERFERAVCDEFLPLTEGALCRPLCGTLFGCTVDEDCPRDMTTADPRCEMIEVGSTGARTGVCVFRELSIDFCEGGGGLAGEQVLACHRRPDGRPTSSWYEGDCDEDGCPNGADPDPCDDADTMRCGSVRRGGDQCAPDVPALDGGVSAQDDAGVVDDERDGGAGDAAVSGMDAGTGPGPSAPPGTEFGGGGGFRCASPGRAPGGIAMLAWLAALGGFAARRRR